MNNINKLLLTTALVTCSFSAASAQVSNKNFVGPSVEVGIQFKNLDSAADDAGAPAILKNDSNTLGRLAFNYGLPTSDKLVVTLGASYTAGKSKASTSDYAGTTNAVYDNMYALYIQQRSVHVRMYPRYHVHMCVCVPSMPCAHAPMYPL